MRPSGPVADANVARNARRERGRRARWAPARDALWDLIDPWLAPGSRVAVVGAGNGDDLPLARIAARAASLTLVDLDARAAARARGSVRRGLRRRVRLLEHDVTAGAANRVVAEAVSGAVPTAAPEVPHAPLPGGAYDVVVGDLLYTQLLYPALLDAGVPVERRRSTIDRHGAALTRAVVARLHASAPLVVHLQDVACWGNGYDQPVALGAILDAAGNEPDRALGLAAGAKGPRESDPRAALAGLGLPIRATELWRWPFVEGVDYLVVGTVAGGGPGPEGGPGSSAMAP